WPKCSCATSAAASVTPATRRSCTRSRPMTTRSASTPGSGSRCAGSRWCMSCGLVDPFSRKALKSDAVTADEAAGVARDVKGMKRRNDASDDVAAAELLEDYVVTRAPRLSQTTGLPPVSMPDENPEPKQEMRPIAERRGERRVTTVRRVAASYPG